MSFERYEPCYEPRNVNDYPRRMRRYGVESSVDGGRTWIDISTLHHRRNIAENEAKCFRDENVGIRTRVRLILIGKTLTTYSHKRRKKAAVRERGQTKGQQWPNNGHMGGEAVP